MFKFNPEGVAVTETAVTIHGVWEMGGTKRFQVLRLPVEHFLAESVLEALCELHSRPTQPPTDEWEQFLLWG